MPVRAKLDVILALCYLLLVRETLEALALLRKLSLRRRVPALWAAESRELTVAGIGEREVCGVARELL